MGYTHFYDCKTDELSDECTTALKELLDDHYPSLVQFDDDDNYPPEATPYSVRFNGIGYDGHETFIWHGKTPFEFCKTATKPYDKVVVAALTIIKHFHPIDFDWRSDGETGELTEGRELAFRYLDGVKDVDDLINHSE